MRKILYISGTRADYGLMKYTFNKIQNHPELQLEIIATGMHLMDEFGNTINEIKKDGFKYHIIDSTYDKDDKESMLNFIGTLIQKMPDVIEKIEPDIILLLGDRGEMLAGAIAGAYLSIPVAHLHGGEISSTVDDLARHAITKLSNIHLPANLESAKRIIKMGEDPELVFVVGAPGLDSVLCEKLIEPEKIAEIYDLDLSQPIILVLQHPVTLEVEDAPFQIRETLEAALDLKIQTILVYPNADAGGRSMINTIQKYENNAYLKTFKSLPRRDYLSLLNIASVLVGNSSSGIIEAASFKLPVVNIGTRQNGRDRAENVIDATYKKENIRAKILYCLSDEEFKNKVKYCKNPYGEGTAGTKVVDILSKIPIDQNLLQKRANY
ncbi:GDP/UDP-N,N'-diacetylbacillosamine 2-epimerase (hydrolysing) [Methanococcoides vulcani]|uniref:GDP/UDP-N,N'-diacetylbacillosamine 2-epimerase (Hydrolysing) n=2 Tax=Methanococcoides vulcani TaxID=1353158 RepID=A0A1I0ANW5_9EURY|nr:GDP/UDP-N,N'-diacetylbacillosamine 2-epimerase (hydrolysing) [Methanococcoides vulcani]